ncbi:universal stress protein [Streptomyces sp. NE06-03E]|uniref:Universal stress protein n=2 Tax=Streptomyces TaxID=1883 RepID=A0A652LDA4_9ACTN|nr:MULTISPECIES: universal stress protein [unclassified Streptomyces]WSS59992.1 universal stress protein [Streptomyces sp. NBC_01177]WSS67095.1 universal stress protein [Streptomyces sp. NBC_01175]WSS74012.1 universal stress protein [Streptomyces sp. NBC_01174]MDX3057085.1 universal stress protein [Streptomyces sp. NE06-03E]MDX3326481.1 universal stress protein [Streptomyces sp. ME02-6979-3A]
MSTEGQIVVGIDGSDHARSAVSWAAAQADAARQQLCVLYAADLDRISRFASFETVESVKNKGHELLDETAAAVQERHPSLDITRSLSRKEPVSALHDAAGRRGRIVVGSRGRGGFGALLLGSVGLGVATGAAVPVVVVRGESPWSGTGRVTAAVRGATDGDWLEAAAREARLREASLNLLGVRSILARAAGTGRLSDTEKGADRRSEQQIEDLAQSLREAFPGTTVSCAVETGRSAAAVLVEASRRCDLVVVGGRREQDHVSATPGRVAHALLHHSHCPVQIVPRGVTEEVA